MTLNLGTWFYTIATDRTLQSVDDTLMRFAMPVSVMQHNYQRTKGERNLNQTIFCLDNWEQYNIRSDNGSEFTEKKLRTWLMDVGVSTAYIEPGSPWENGYRESFNGKMRDEFFNREIFYTMFEVEVSTRKCFLEYNTIRPHSSLGYRPPAPQIILIVS